MTVLLCLSVLFAGWVQFLRPQVRILRGTVSVGEHIPAKGWIELRLGWGETVRRGDEYEIKARFTPRTILRIFDLASGVEIREVEYAVESFWGPSTDLPSSGCRVAAGGYAPRVTLGSASRSTTARALFTAWGSSA